MSAMLPPEEQLLYDAVCSGQLDAEARGRLQALLRESEPARRRYLDYVALHSDLFGAVRVARVRQELIALMESESVVPRETPARLNVIGRNAARHWRWPVTAAALAASILILVQVTGVMRIADDSERKPLVAESDPADADRWPGLVAQINRIESVVWTPGAQQLAPTEMLSVGSEVSIDGGLVEIEFRQGAVVVLEGPARLIAESANSANLLRGKLAAVAPPWATGFRVDTPGPDIVDHGTEFAVSVAGGSDTPKVNVVVTEGEVEVLPDSKQVKGRRLRAGQGVRSSGAQLEDGDDVAARELTKMLPKRPEFKNAVLVANRWAEWSPGSEGQPCREGRWRYYTNVGGPFGDPTCYVELVWDQPSHAYRHPQHGSQLNEFYYVRAHREGGHPGKGNTQSRDKLDHYSITAYTVPEEGVYRLEAGWLERRWARRWDQDHVMDIAVHVNDREVSMRDYCDRSSFVSFRKPLGMLQAGDTIYVGVGPNGVDHDDKFRWGYYIVRESEPVSRADD